MDNWYLARRLAICGALVAALSATQASAHNVTAESAPPHTCSKRTGSMAEDAMQNFVDSFADAWARRDGEAFLKLWHPHGLLHYPFANRVIKGSELGMLTDFQNKGAPHLTWKLLGWTSRDNVIVIEWESSSRYGDQLVTWSGVDRITLEDGKIIEEIVYADTAPLQALRLGRKFDALMQLPD